MITIYSPSVSAANAFLSVPGFLGPKIFVGSVGIPAAVTLTDTMGGVFEFLPSENVTITKTGTNTFTLVAAETGIFYPMFSITSGQYKVYDNIVFEVS